MPVKKIQLVNAPDDKSFSSSGNVRRYPHLGLLSIATVLKQDHPDVSVEVIDGSINASGRNIAPRRYRLSAKVRA
ncbi:MAG: hypothetical protein GY846_01515 [Deltaproteobacteria bacterium]|nr:hypothetical protein [Deltaproteobacteria bacterium]